MRPLVTFVLFTLAFTTVQSQDLEDLKWERRILIISSTPAQAEMLEQQLNELKLQIDGLGERKLLILDVGLDEVKTPLENHPVKFERTAIPDAYIDPGKFQMVLVGLDGTEKGRYLRPVTCDVLFSKIDSMPMRRNNN